MYKIFNNILFNSHEFSFDTHVNEEKNKKFKSISLEIGTIIRLHVQ